MIGGVIKVAALVKANCPKCGQPALYPGWVSVDGLGGIGTVGEIEQVTPCDKCNAAEMAAAKANARLCSMRFQCLSI